MLDALKASQEVLGTFDKILKKNSELERLIKQVEHHTPISNFSHLLRLDPRFPWKGERDDAYLQKIKNAVNKKQVKQSPKLDHRKINWPDTIECIYQVRCNLIHGGKEASDKEQKFMGLFADILEILISETDPNLFVLGRPT